MSFAVLHDTARRHGFQLGLRRLGIDKPFPSELPDSVNGHLAVILTDLDGRDSRGWVVDEDHDLACCAYHAEQWLLARPRVLEKQFQHESA